ncbi:L-Proline/Glycine betaine transporter ProP [Pseudohaliea rubra DSM 19751]|uniref:L-Proline/Glycine betaine transporter ProP n=1 Tax=Pseudohaliea rubra DSM 19751 TaxID=1265313 RepID=A0A095VQR2_9GAMM|nr:L-Proline/Glycine betaine transporter ProP [Pseudohaliea rubra DSM 19751]
MLEWYDFAIFGFLAPTMSPLFFPDDDPVVALIQTYGIFAAGYLMRPLGGIVFGHIADRIGRTQALRWSIAMMAVPTVLVGLLPTHANIGASAAALLILLRLVQGVSVGGELIASITFLVEAAPDNRRGLHGSWALFGAVSGILLGSAVVSLVEAFIDPQAMSDYGWRIPFLLGLVIFLMGRWLRSILAVESPKGGGVQELPLKRVLTQHLGSVLHLILCMLLYAAAFYVLFVWMPTYLSKIIPTPVSHAMAVNTLSTVFLVLLLPVAGWLGDRFGLRTILLLGIALLGLVAYPLFVWLDTGSLVAALVSGLVFALLVSWVQGPMPALLAQTFPSDIRNTGVGIAYNAALGLFGGTAPMVCTWLISRTGDIAAPAYYLAALAAVSFVALSTLRLAGHD